MTERKKYPQALLFLDLETDGIPEGNDYASVNILEVGAVVTDFDLQKFKGFHEVASITPEVIENLKKQPEVIEMHKKSGLLEDLAKSDKTVRDLEDELIQLLKDCSFEPKEYILAGSGVGTFDFQLIKEHMPRLATWLQYYVLDIGVMRRTVFYLSNRRQFIPDVRKSYMDGHKAHRAFDDVLAHIEEAELYKDWLRGLP